MSAIKTKLRIVVVDDEIIIARTLQEILVDLGHDVPEIAISKEEAIESAKRIMPDLVFMDIRLSGAADGIEAGEYIAIKLGIPVIFLTAYCDEATFSRAKAAKPYGYLIKPVSVRDIQIVTNIAIGRREVERELEQVKRDLQRQAEKTRAIIDSTNEAFVAIDAGGAVIDWNPAAESTFGWSKEEIIGRKIVDTILPQSYRTGFLTGMQQFLQLGVSSFLNTRMELKGLNKQGYEFPVELIISSLTAGDSITFHAFIHDITQRKLQQQTLGEAESRLRRLTSSISDCLWSAHVNSKGKLQYTYFSPVIENLAGRGAEAILAEKRQWRSIVHPDDQGKIENAVTCILSNRVIDTTIQYRIVLADGSIKWVEDKISVENESLQCSMDVHAAKLKPSKDAIKINGVISDITKRKEAEKALKIASQELSRSNTDLEQFAYVASHDLQEPLRKLTNFTGLFLEKYGGTIDDVGRRYLNYVSDGAMRMNILIDDLLAYSRIGRQNDSGSALSLDEVLRDVLNEQRDSIRKFCVSVELDPLPSIKFARTEAYQLFSNLISNAIKFRRDDVPPRISIKCQRSENCWQFTVSDNGIGLNEEYKEEVFVIFRRLHSRAKYPGTGIGLAICKKIVERHGGKISIISAVGNGTSVHFTLPFNSDDTPTLCNGDMHSLPSRENPNLCSVSLM